LNEPWLPPGPASYTGALPGDAHPQFDLPGPVKIPPGEYFVMGDNRLDSEDSRFFGPIPRSLIVGRAEFVAWPLNHIKGL
jgi:signal peptidase I